jgi:hypothetical protein
MGSLLENLKGGRGSRPKGRSASSRGKGRSKVGARSYVKVKGRR